MARPLRIEYPGAFYHVTSRGNERKEIFKSQRDREKFLGYLKSATTRYGAGIHCYCLMDNHYHLLLETPEGNLSQIMRHINGAYTTYFNVKRCRSGHLLQGRYRAILVEADAYALELSRYLHLNPVRAGIVARPEEYPWSSYLAYVGECPTPDWLRVDFVLDCLTAKSKRGEDYCAFVADRSGRDCASLLQEVVASTMLGSEPFLNEVRHRLQKGNAEASDVPALKALRVRPRLEEIVAAVCGSQIDDPRLARKVAVYLCRQLSGEKLKVIGAYFQLGDSAVSQLCRRFSCQLKGDELLQRVIAELKDDLGMSDVKI